MRGLVIAFMVVCSAWALGCGAAVTQAAKEAAPAAVEGAAEEAKDPQTRDNLATLLGDPEIHEAAARLSRAIVDGALSSLGEPERSAEIQRLAAAIASNMGAAFGRSLERDIGPRMTALIAEAVGASLERALDTRTEQRVEALAQAMGRGALRGIGESMFDPMTGEPSPAFALMIGRVAREVTRQAAFGFDDAVQDAENNDVPPDGEAQVLAAIGRSSRWLLALPALVVIGAVLLGALLLGALLWTLLRLRHHRRLSRAHEDAALALARAIKETEGATWSDELRQHIASATRGSAGGDELERLLREHGELRLRPRAEPRHPERSATIG